jgi:RNA polymerase sigma-70 factor, ECF subfamily
VLDTQKQVGQTHLTKQRYARLPADMSRPEIDQLFAECLPKMQKLARRMFRNEEDSEDALQEAMLLAFRKIHQFQGRSSFSTWLHSIVRNTSWAHYRKTSAHPTLSTDQINCDDEGSLADRAFIDERLTPEEAYEQEERSQIFREAAEELPTKYQPALYLFYRKGLGEEATAKALGITVSALKAQLHRSRVVLSWKIRKKHLRHDNGAVFSARTPLHTRHWVSGFQIPRRQVLRKSR